MEIRKTYKFKLKPNTNQKIQFARFAGCSRFVWNRALALVKHSLERKEGYLNYHDLAEELTIWKQIKETDFLTAVFVCQSCGHEGHADHNAATNILEAGHASIACGDIRPVAV